MNIPDVVNKFIDNANVGKVVTDGGSGLALSLPILMLIGLSSGMSVLPADRLQEELQPRLATARVAHLRNRDAFCADVEVKRRLPDEATKGTSSAREDEAQKCYLDGVREAARLNGEIAILDSQYAADLKAGKAVEGLLAKHAALQPRADRLTVQQQLTEESAARLTEIENEVRDAKSFAFNIRTLTENVGTILGLALILGVMGSQIARYVFINQIYDRLVPSVPTDFLTAVSSDYDSLRANYLRYVEGAINMILPVMAFVIVFPTYSATKLGITPSRGGWLSGGVIVSTLLFLIGLSTYRSYQQKVAQFARVSPIPRDSVRSPDRNAAHDPKSFDEGQRQA